MNKEIRTILTFGVTLICIICTAMITLLILINTKDLYSGNVNIPNTYEEGFSIDNLSESASKLIGAWYSQGYINNEKYSGVFYFYNNNTGEVLCQLNSKSYFVNFEYQYNVKTNEVVISVNRKSSVKMM